MRKRYVIAIVVLAALRFAPSPLAQRAAPGADQTLVGSWTLSGVQRPSADGTPGQVPNPRGLLVFDGAGHVCEIATRAGRTQYAGAQSTPDEALTTFMEYGGLWGSYRADQAEGRIAYMPEGAVNPNAMGRELSRRFEISGDKLTITSLGELTAPAGTRWTWTRVPNLEGLSEPYRRLIGFWREVSERTIATGTGAVLSEVLRGPSVIAYTPSGFVCVHFLPGNRKPFASTTPTPQEAKAAVTGYTSYIAALAVHPGFIFHHQLATLAPAPASSLQRYYEFINNDSEVNYLFPPNTVGGQERRTQVVLRRISGAAEMMPR